MSTLKIITGLNGVSDGKVDVRDISYVVRHFGVWSMDPAWDPEADINGDGKVDIKDVSITVRSFGQHYP